MGTPATLSQVPALTPYVQYVATSLQTVFPYPFPITQDSDLVVVLNGVTQPTDSGYTVSGVGNPTGGNITFTVGLTAGVIVTLFRDITIERITQIGQNSGFSSQAFNAEFNNIYLILQQLSDSLGFALQIPNTNAPAPTTTLTPAAYANKYLAFDSNGNPTPALLTSSGSLTQALLLGLINPQTPYELAAGITPASTLYLPGHLPRYGGKADSGTTDNTLALTNACAAVAGTGVPVVIDVLGGAAGSGYYGNINGVVPVPAGVEIQMKNGAKLAWASTVAASGPTFLGTACRPGLWIKGNNFKLTGQGSIVGPSAPGTYVGQEVGIVAVGASAVAPITGIQISDGVEVTGWGYDALLFKWCTTLRIHKNNLHDVGYGGVHFMSCNDIVINDNDVHDISPGNSGNAYGISFTFDSTTSPTSSRSDANHFCIGVTCKNNFVYNNPLWLGIDAHGLFDGNIDSNKVYNCQTGIQIASAPSGAIGENNAITNNEVNISQFNGSATTVVSATPMGITVNGYSSSVLHAGVRVTGNTIIGYGNNASPPTAFSIQASYLDNPVIADNIIRSWSGFGIYSVGSNGGKISGNTFGALASAYVDDACIQIQSSNSPWHIEGNMHHIASGTAAHFGAVNNTGSAADCLWGINDFTSAQTAAYGGASGSVLAASHFLPYPQPITATALLANTSTNGGVGYSTGAGGTVTQTSSRTTLVTLNTLSGQITLVSAAGSASPQTFQVSNTQVAATDTVNACQASGTDLYEVFVTHVQAGSFKITFFTTGGTTTEQPVFNFNVVKGASS